MQGYASFVANEQESEPKVSSEADSAGCKKTRRSTSAVVAIVAGGAVSWMSHLQRRTALSTSEAEIVAANEGPEELTLLNRLLSEISSSPAAVPKLFVNSASAVKSVKNPGFHISKSDILSSERKCRPTN